MKRFVTVAALSILAFIAASTQIAPAQSSPVQSEFDSSNINLDDFTPATAPESTVTAREQMKAMLDEMGYKYKEEKSGSLKVILGMGDDRTQAVWVSGKSNKIGDVEIIGVSSPGYLVEGEMPGEVAALLLKDTARKTLGAWETAKSGEQTLGLFVSKISTESSTDMLEAALYSAAISADKMEKQLMPESDRF